MGSWVVSAPLLARSRVKILDLFAKATLFLETTTLGVVHAAARARHGAQGGSMGPHGASWGPLGPLRGMPVRAGYTGLAPPPVENQTAMYPNALHDDCDKSRMVQPR